MPRPCPPLILAVVLAGLSVAGPPLSARAELPEYLALALPISGITVDGDLSDWPGEMPALPILNEFGAYGPTDTEGTDLSTSRDLSPSFRVGYDPEEQLLYVAVQVRDDILYPVDSSVSRTDACEIYVSGLLSEDHPPIQYALVPGQATYPAFDRRGVHLNLRIDRRSRGAWQRQGDLTTYEWGVQVRSSNPRPLRTDPRYGHSLANPAPGRAVPLEGGGMIGFDVVVVDGDGPAPEFRGHSHRLLSSEETASWVPWGPPVPVKMMGDSRVGRLVLAPEDWSGGFDFDAMEVYLATWLRDHPDVWISAIERSVARRSRPHDHPLARRLDQAAGVARADARVLGIEAPGAATWDHRTAPWRSPGDPMGEGFSPTYVPLGASSGRGDWPVLLGGCLLGLAFGLAAVYVLRRRSGSDSAVLGDRLAALESRMTDTQDVMIALSEKLDRLDARDRGGSGS
ncbi:MAG: hypothetical protein OXG13_09030 [Gemmatimonadaceae bacterium]|nr:hypothetical protein [Gemmatimonadaceae bacterium]